MIEETGPDARIWAGATNITKTFWKRGRFRTEAWERGKEPDPSAWHNELLANKDHVYKNIVASW